MLFSFVTSFLLGWIQAYRFRNSQGMNGGLSDTLTKSEDDIIEDYFEEQLIDHFNTQNTKTYKQRYFMNIDHLGRSSYDSKICGPIFLEIGGEGPISERYVNGSFTNLDWAIKFQGAIVALEHRYYGKSFPTDNVSTQNLKAYLSSQQAIADLVYFIPYIKEKLNCNEDTKVIVSGGSYPGSLASYSRSQHPYVINGAISSSGPVFAKMNYPEYFEHVEKSIRKYSLDKGDKCIKALNNVYTYIDETLNKKISEEAVNARLDVINNAFKPLTSKVEAIGETYSKLDAAHFVESLSDPIAGVIQYAMQESIEKEGDIYNMCDNLLSDIDIDSDKEMTVLQFAKVIRDKRISRYFYESEEAIQTRFNDMVNDITFENTDNENLSSRSWFFQTCREFGYYQVGTETIGNTLVDLDYFYSLCEKVYDLPKEVVATKGTWTNRFYGGRNTPTSNIFYANSDIDPWSELSIRPDLKWADGQFTHKDNKIVMIEAGSHCSDLYSPKQGESTKINEVREMEVEAISKWLNLKPLEKKENDKDEL